MTTDARRLEELLEREIEAAQQLSAALLAERAALTGDKPAAVNDTAAEKLRVLGVIEKLEHERRTLCAPRGHASPGDAVNGVGSVVTDRWRSLMELMAGCRKANDVNGHIIHIRQNQIRQLIEIVHGGPPITYGPHGRTFATALRALARA